MSQSAEAGSEQHLGGLLRSKYVGNTEVQKGPGLGLGPSGVHNQVGKRIYTTPTHTPLQHWW